MYAGPKFSANQGREGEGTRGKKGYRVTERDSQEGATKGRCRHRDKQSSRGTLLLLEIILQRGLLDELLSL